MSHPNGIATPVRAAVFDTPEEAQQIIDALLARKFEPEEITVVSSDETKERYFRTFEHQQQAGRNSPAAAAVGGAIGATLFGLSAVTVSLATGGVPLAVAGGWAVMAGGVTGGFLGAMLTRGIEKEAANYYDQAVVEGKILIAVEIHGDRADQRLAMAEEILKQGGADPVPLPEG